MKAQKVSEADRDLVHGRSSGTCEICGSAAAVDIHHRTGRQMGGSREPWVNRPGNLIHACRICHDKVTNTRGFRALHENNGWLVRRGITLPRDVPVLLWHYQPGRDHNDCFELVLLDDEGSYTPQFQFGGVS
jgi:5-methylcytosine-specific restriction enzyme A